MSTLHTWLIGWPIIEGGGAHRHSTRDVSPGDGSEIASTLFFSRVNRSSYPRSVSKLSAELVQRLEGYMKVILKDIWSYDQQSPTFGTTLRTIIN